VVDVADAGSPPVDVPPADVPDTGVPTGTVFCDLPVPSGMEVPSSISVPGGFCIRRFARVQTPRVMAFAPNGDLFVSSPSTGTPGGAPLGRGAIVTLHDDDGNGFADTVAPEQTNFLTRVDSVHGLLFGPNTLMYTLDDGVYELPYQRGDRTARTPQRDHRTVAELRDYMRWTHTLARGVDGNLYVSMGQYDIAQCPPPAARQGSILRIDNGAPLAGEVITQGFRNPMYMRCMPWGACYAAELSGDGWRSIGGVEKLIEIRRGDNYGFPCCVDRGMPVPGVGTMQGCANVAASVQTYPLHDTPFGFDWAPSSWPAPYGGSFFVGLHGWVGSWTNTGVQWAPVDASTHRPTRPTEFFVSGWGRAGGISGRVTDLVFAPDGRMFFSDDQDGAIYWVAPATLRAPAR